MKKLVTIGAILASTLLTGCGFTTVDNGERGVEVSFGEIKEVLPEGFHTYNPLTTSVVFVDTKVQRRDAKASAYTKDVQQVDIAFTVTYSLKPDAVASVFKQVGTNWEQRFVEPVVQAGLKEVVGQYEATDLVSKRGEASDKIRTRLSDALIKNGVQMADFNITNLDFNDEFERAVESKVRAVQEAEKAENETVRIREEATQKIITAKAEAEAMKIQSEALRENKGLTEYKAVEKWNGVLPTMMMGNTVPFINLSK